MRMTQEESPGWLQRLTNPRAGKATLTLASVERSVLKESIMRDLTYRSPKTEVQASPIQGKGLFAKEAIAAGEIVAVKGGHILTEQEWTTFERGLGAADIQISEELFIAPVEQERRDGSMIYTNHSCDPNIAIQGQIVFVAMRDIAPGEELPHDWATAVDREYDKE